MSAMQAMYEFILEINKLKLVFRKTKTHPDRNESTAEHSWTAGMITMVVMDEIKQEFPGIDDVKVLKLALIHDIVEIYAGDVILFNTQARKDQEKIEHEALQKLMAIYPEFGNKLHTLWHEFEKRETIESKVAKAADAICPVFLRVSVGQSYKPFDIQLADLEKKMWSYFEFSKTFSALFQKLLNEAVSMELI